MPYNEHTKKAMYKYRAKDPERWREYALETYHKYREQHLAEIQEKDRIRKRPFEIEWRIFRKIELFN